MTEDAAASSRIEHTPGRIGEDAGVTGSRVALAVVAALHVAFVSLLVLGLASGGTGLAASGVVAYALGLRHAVDADHICMIDNSTRKFVAEGKRSATVGLAFSAGHSRVVLIAAALVLVGSGWLASTIQEDSATRHWLSATGAAVAATYLAAITVTNLKVLARAWRDLRGHEAVVPGHHGGLSRLLLAPLAKVREPWHVYGSGLLFGFLTGPPPKRLAAQVVGVDHDQTRCLNVGGDGIAHDVRLLAVLAHGDGGYAILERLRDAGRAPRARRRASRLHLAQKGRTLC